MRTLPDSRIANFFDRFGIIHPTLMLYCLLEILRHLFGNEKKTGMNECVFWTLRHVFGVSVLKFVVPTFGEYLRLFVR